MWWLLDVFCFFLKKLLNTENKQYCWGLLPSSPTCGLLSCSWLATDTSLIIIFIKCCRGDSKLQWPFPGFCRYWELRNGLSAPYFGTVLGLWGLPKAAQVGCSLRRHNAESNLQPLTEVVNSLSSSFLCPANSRSLDFSSQNPPATMTSGYGDCWST